MKSKENTGEKLLKRSAKKESSHRGSKQEHDKILKDTLILLGREASALCRAFSNPTGVAYIDRDSFRVYIHYGVEGSGDIYGFMSDGRIFYFEIKSGNATQSKKQKNFQAMCQKFNARYFVIKSAQEALSKIIEWSATNARNFKSFSEEQP